jgi:hypothetical protein
MPENTVKPGFEIEPMATPEPLPHDPMDAHWQALIAERDKLKEEVEGLRKAVKQNYSVKNLEIETLRKRVSELERALESIRDFCARDVCDGIARAALEKIKFRNEPGTTNHELAKEALSRTSEGK